MTAIPDNVAPFVRYASVIGAGIYDMAHVDLSAVVDWYGGSVAIDLLDSGAGYLGRTLPLVTGPSFAPSWRVSEGARCDAVARATEAVIANSALRTFDPMAE